MKQFLFAAALLATVTSVASADDADINPARFGWFSGDWSLTVGASGFAAPDYDGSDELEFWAVPIISLGRAGPAARFVSRNDNISIALIDHGRFRAGPTGKLIFGRDGGDSPNLVGLDEVRFGGELGAFAEIYPFDWMRVRGEVRHGIRSHDGIVADLAVDAFLDVTETVRISGGPRLSYASDGYFDAFYGISPAEGVASGLAPYDPGSGIRSAGLGGAITWKTTDQLTTSLFGEYERLAGPAADSPLVRGRGSRDQFTFGLSAAYRFDFTIR